MIEGNGIASARPVLVRMSIASKCLDRAAHDRYVRGHRLAEGNRYDGLALVGNFVRSAARHNAVNGLKKAPR